MSTISRRATLEVTEVPSRNGYPAFSDAEMQRRYEWIRENMREQGLDAVIAGGATGGLETTVQYFTNWPPLVESFLVFGRDGESTIFVRLWNHLPDAKLISCVEDVRYGGDTGRAQAENVASFIVKHGWTKARIGWLGEISAGSMLHLQQVLENVEWIDLRDFYGRFRLVKSNEEMTFIRVASKFNDTAVGAMQSQIRLGIREYEIAKIIEDTYLDQRGSNMIHFTMSTPMDRPSRCVPHQFHPDRLICEGDVIAAEISTSFWGYAGQILRSFTVGCGPTPQYRGLYEVAMAAYRGIVNRLKPGVTVGEILDEANVISRAGYTILDDLVHGQGGAYLPPIIRTRETRGATHPDDFAYPAGAVIVVQPNVTTLDGTAGVQVGNAVRITEDGVEVLQDYPMEFLRCA